MTRKRFIKLMRSFGSRCNINIVNYMLKEINRGMSVGNYQDAWDTFRNFALDTINADSDEIFKKLPMLAIKR